MKVYASHPKYEYTGGALLIASDSLREARKVLEHHWRRNDLFEPILVRGLTSDAKEPQVIADYVYTE